MPIITPPAGNLIEAFAVEELSHAEREGIRQLAREEAITRALAAGIATNRHQLTVRYIRPLADLSAGAVTYEQWLTGALTAGTEYTFVNNVTLDIKRTLIIFGGFTNAPNPSPSEFRFRQNTGGTVPLAFVNVQHINVNLVNKWIMSEMIAYDPQDIINITIMPTITAAGGQVVGFLGYVAEPKGRSFVGPSV